MFQMGQSLRPWVLISMEQLDHAGDAALNHWCPSRMTLHKLPRRASGGWDAVTCIVFEASQLLPCSILCHASNLQWHLACTSLSTSLRYARVLVSFNWVLLFTPTSNCCQNVFQLIMLQSKIGTLILGSLMQLLILQGCWWPVPSLSSCFIWRLKLKRAVSRADS